MSAAGFSQYGADTNYPLLVAVLKAAQDYGVKQHYDYVIVTGDYLAHDFTNKYQRLIDNDEAAFQAFVIKTIIFISRTIQASFPSLPVFGMQPAMQRGDFAALGCASHANCFELENRCIGPVIVIAVGPSSGFIQMATE